MHKLLELFNIVTDTNIIPRFPRSIRGEYEYLDTVKFDKYDNVELKFSPDGSMTINELEALVTRLNPKSYRSIQATGSDGGWCNIESFECSGNHITIIASER